MYNSSNTSNKGIIGIIGNRGNMPIPIPMPNNYVPGSIKINEVQQQQQQQLIIIDNISNKIYNHFKNKYPSTYEATGITKNTINTIVSKATQNNNKNNTNNNNTININSNIISKIIDIIDYKFKSTIHSDNRQGIQYDITNFSMDNESKIPMEKYLENYTHKISTQTNATHTQGKGQQHIPPYITSYITSSSTISNIPKPNDKLQNLYKQEHAQIYIPPTIKQTQSQTQAQAQAQAHAHAHNNTTGINTSTATSSITDINNNTDINADIDENTDENALTINNQFNEDFPLRDRKNQTDMLTTETRDFDYYVVINSNDRNVSLFANPNYFIIDFAPAPAASSTDARIGYIERNFNNIKSCELMNVIIRDTSELDDSSDADNKSYPYLLLQFEELQRNYYGSNDVISKSFAILSDYTTSGKYKYYSMFGDHSQNTVSRIYNPRINLNKITTKLLLPSGEPFSFGTSNINDTTNACISFGLRIITIQKTLSTQFINNA